MRYAEVFDAYHRWYYKTAVWDKVRFLGVPVYKSVSDLWSYQEVLSRLRPSLLIEFGTWCGGSALYFDTVMAQLERPYRILSVDIDQERKKNFWRPETRSKIEFMQCSSADPKVAARIAELRREYPGPAFAILDSDHRAEHVSSELELLRPLLATGDYLVVEDGNLNGHPVLPGWGRGPYEALSDYERLHPDDYEHDTATETKFGFTFAPRGFLIRR